MYDFFIIKTISQHPPSNSRRPDWKHLFKIFLMYFFTSIINYVLSQKLILSIIFKLLS